MFFVVLVYILLLVGSLYISGLYVAAPAPPTNNVLAFLRQRESGRLSDGTTPTLDESLSTQAATFLAKVSVEKIKRIIATHRINHKILGPFHFVLYSVKENVYYKFRSDLNINFVFIARLDLIDPLKSYFDVVTQSFVSRSCDFKLVIDEDKNSNWIQVVYSGGLSNKFALLLPNKNLQWVRNGETGALSVKHSDMCDGQPDGSILPVQYRDFVNFTQKINDNTNAAYNYDNKVSTDAVENTTNGLAGGVGGTVFRHGYWQCTNNRAKLVLCEKNTTFNGSLNRCISTGICDGKPDGFKVQHDSANPKTYSLCQNSQIQVLFCPPNYIFNGSECVLEDICSEAEDGTTFPIFAAKATIHQNPTASTVNGQADAAAATPAMASVAAEMDGSTAATNDFVNPNISSVALSAIVASDGKAHSADDLDESASTNEYIKCFGHKSKRISCGSRSRLTPDKRNCVDIQCLSRFDAPTGKYNTSPVFTFGDETNTVKRIPNGCTQCNDNGRIINNTKCPIRTKKYVNLINGFDLKQNRWSLVDNEHNRVYIEIEVPVSVLDLKHGVCEKLEELELGTSIFTSYFKKIQPVQNKFVDEKFPAFSRTLFVDIDPIIKFNARHLITEDNIKFIFTDLSLIEDMESVTWVAEVTKQVIMAHKATLATADTGANNQLPLRDPNESDGGVGNRDTLSTATSPPKPQNILDYFHAERLLQIWWHKKQQIYDAADIKKARYKSTNLQRPHFVYDNELYLLKFTGPLAKTMPADIKLEFSRFTPHVAVHENPSFATGDVTVLAIGNHILEYIDRTPVAGETAFAVSEDDMDEACRGLGLGKLHGVTVYSIGFDCWCNDRGRVIDAGEVPCVEQGFSISPSSKLQSQCREQKYRPLWSSDYYIGKVDPSVPATRIEPDNPHGYRRENIWRYIEDLKLAPGGQVFSLGLDYTQRVVHPALTGTYYAVNSSQNIIDRRININRMQ